jgi:hypothetical protein
MGKMFNSDSLRSLSHIVSGRPGRWHPWVPSGERTPDARLPRKEVIQPHLPVRLPCYDFTPITDPTLDVCPPYGLARRLQVLPTFVV